MTLKSQKAGDLEKVKGEVMTLTDENTKLQANIRELQAQIFTLQAKSPEVWDMKCYYMFISLVLKLLNTLAKLQNVN